MRQLTLNKFAKVSQTVKQHLTAWI